MRLIYVSEHKFIRGENGQVYTTGQMGNMYFERFRDVFDTVFVLGYIEDINDANQKKIVDQVNENDRFVNYVFIPRILGNLSEIMMVKKLMKEVSRLIKREDALTVKAPSFAAGKVVRTGRLNHIPCMVELVACPWDVLWNHSVRGKLVAPIEWNITRKAVKNALYVSYVTNKFLQGRYPSKGKSMGCSDVDLQSADKNILERRLYKIEQTTFNKPIVLGTVASVDARYKGQEYCIRAISKLNRQGRDFEYHLVGGGSSSFLKSMAEKHGVAEKVKFLGPMPHEKVFEYLDNIDIYIQPSKIEGLPRALVEAMSRGCPSLGSSAGGIPELLNSDFIFNNGSVSEICTLLKRMDKKTMAEEAKRSFEKAKEYYRDNLNERRNSFYKEFANWRGVKYET